MTGCSTLSNRLFPVPPPPPPNLHPAPHPTLRGYIKDIVREGERGGRKGWLPLSIMNRRSKVAMPGVQQCQRCLQYGHWSYECAGQRAYVFRPSLSMQRRNPTLRHQLTEERPPEDEPVVVLPPEVPAKRKRSDSVSSSSSSSSSESSASAESKSSGSSHRS